MGAPRVVYVIEMKSGDDPFLSAYSSIEEIPAHEAGNAVHRYEHTGVGELKVAWTVDFPAPMSTPAEPPAGPVAPARKRGPRRKPEGVSVQTRDPAVEQAAAALPEPAAPVASEEAPPAPQQAPDPAPAAPAPGSPAALTDLLAKYVEKFGTIKLFLHIQNAGGKRIRDLDPHGRAQLLAALEKDMAG